MENEEKGIALITSLIIMMIIAIMSGALIFATTTQYRIGRRNRLDKVAVALAEAGIDYGIWKLNSTNGQSPAHYEGFLGEGRFTVDITSPTFEGRLLTAIGYTKNDEYKRKIVVRVEMAKAIDPYNFAAFGNNRNDINVTLGGSALIDSYDSDTGTGTLLGHGDIGSNGDIVIGGSADVNGAAMLVTGNTLTGTVEDGVIYTDTYASLPDIPTFSATQSLNVNSDITLTTGTYYYTSVSVKKNLIIVGQVEIYVLNTFTAGGGGTVNIVGNSRKDATKCSIFVKGGGTAVDIGSTGNADICASIYAPNGNVKLRGTSTIYGNLIGNSLDISGNSTLLFDENLKEKQKPIWWAADVSYCRVITSWQRF